MANTLDPDVADLSRAVVRSLAPQELPMFTAISREYAKNPDKAMKATEGRDEVLGFGVEAALPLLTPIVIRVAQAVIRFVASEVLKATTHEAADAIEHTVHSALAPASGKQESMTTAPLSAAQLTEVRRVALNRAVSLQLPRDQAERLADAMVARLATTAG